MSPAVSELVNPRSSPSVVLVVCPVLLGILKERGGEAKEREGRGGEQRGREGGKEKRKGEKRRGEVLQHVL